MRIFLTMICVGILCLIGCMDGPKPDQTQINVARAEQSQGESFLAQGNHTAALSKLLEAKKVLKEDPFLLNSLGLAYMGKKRDDLALESFQAALTQKPDFTEAINNKGAVFMRMKRWDEAIAAFNQVLDDILYPTPHFPLSNLGFAYLEKGDFAMAEVYFRKALDMQPWYLTASHGLAQMYMKSNRPEQAIKYLKVCLQRTPDVAILHADMARALEQQGHFHPAKAHWMKVARLSPMRSALAREAEAKLMKIQN